MYECFKKTGLNKLQYKILPLDDAAELLSFFWITEVVLGVVLVLIGLLGLFWVLEDIFGSARLGDSTFVSFGFLAPQPQCLFSHEQVSILPSFDTKHICNEVILFFKFLFVYVELQIIYCKDSCINCSQSLLLHSPLVRNRGPHQPVGQTVCQLLLLLSTSYLIQVCCSYSSHLKIFNA